MTIEDAFGPGREQEAAGDGTRCLGRRRDALDREFERVQRLLLISGHVFDRSASEPDLAPAPYGFGHRFGIVAKAVLKVPGDGQVGGENDGAASVKSLLAGYDIRPVPPAKRERYPRSRGAECCEKPKAVRMRAVPASMHKERW